MQQPTSPKASIQSILTSVSFTRKRAEITLKNGMAVANIVIPYQRARLPTSVMTGGASACQ